MQFGRPIHNMNEEASTWRSRSSSPIIVLCEAGTYLTEGNLSMAMELTGPCSSAAVPDEEGMHGLWVGLMGGLEPPLGAGKEV